MSPYVYLTSVLGQPGVDSSPGALLPHVCYRGGCFALLWPDGWVRGRERESRWAFDVVLWDVKYCNETSNL